MGVLWSVRYLHHCHKSASFITTTIAARYAMRYGLPQMLRGRQSLLTPNFTKVNYSMLERSTGIAGVTKATLGSE
ncbi:hypothetical protein Tco_1150810, partial [Tanacetum coccineum]